MKKICFNYLLFFLVFLFIGCATQNSRQEGNEIWNDIHSINDFVGKWEGYTVVYIPKNQENLMPASSIEVSISFEYIRGFEEVIGTMTVDMNRFLTDWLSIEEIREAGYTKDNLWELLVREFEKHEDLIIGGRYYINYDLSDRVDTFFSSDSNGKFQINKNGDKLKLMYYEAVSFGLGDLGFKEIILNKKQTETSGHTLQVGEYIRYQKNPDTGEAVPFCSEGAGIL